MITLIFSATIILITLLLIAYEQRRLRQPFSIGVLFLYYALFYSIAPVLSFPDEKNVIFICSYLYISSCFLYFFYSFLSVKKNNHSLVAKRKKAKKIHYISITKLLLVCTTGLLITTAVYVVFIKIGFGSFFFQSRAERSLDSRSLGMLMAFRELISATAIFSLTSWLFLKRDKTYLFLFGFLASVSVAFAILTISRAHFIAVIFPVLFLLSFYGKIKNWQVWLILSLGFIVAVLWKMIFSFIIFDTQIEIGLSLLTLPSEFSQWFEIYKDVAPIDLLYGSSFIDAMLSLLYPFYAAESLSIWYVKNYHYSLFNSGGGRGFSVFVEAIINFGIIGPVLIFSIIGLILGVIQRKSTASIFFLYASAVTLPYLHRIFRSDFMSLTKTWWWLFIFSMLIIYFFRKLIIKINRK